MSVNIANILVFIIIISAEQFLLEFNLKNTFQ